MNPHRQHADMAGLPRPSERRLNIGTAVAVGLIIAAALVAWWSA